MYVTHMCVCEERKEKKTPHAAPYIKYLTYTQIFVKVYMRMKLHRRSYIHIKYGL